MSHAFITRRGGANSVIPTTITMNTCGADAIVTLLHESGKSFIAYANSNGIAEKVVMDPGTYTISTSARALVQSVTIVAGTEQVIVDMMAGAFYYNGLNPNNTFYKISSSTYGALTVTPERDDGGVIEFYYGYSGIRYSGDGWCSALAGSTNRIDVTNYNYLKFEGRVSAGGADTSGTGMGLSLTNNGSGIVKSTWGTGKGTIDAIDISDLSGEYYFVAYSRYYHGYQSSGSCSLNLYRAWLE